MILDTIKNRRSIFPNQFEAETISDDKIRTLLEAANWAPTHAKTEPWRFKIFKDDALELLADILKTGYTKTTPADKFSEFKLNKSIEKVMQSGAVIAICMQRDPKARIPEWEEIAAVGMAVQNMWLTAGEQGLGGYWSSPGYITELGTELKLNEGEKCLGFFYLGVFNGPNPEGVRTSIEDKITWF
ncbi:nitroreductase family protein [Leeuwenhoekiella sp. W20_SRS_FM14]|uniref:nitroreductase family protein n=1 Tax=Leeuwenhoekiella sp. W20_SRS_FM14 TaxID=3240270 RepID=UPI003F9E9289